MSAILRPVIPLLLVAVASLLTSCGSFNKQWEEAIGSNYTGVEGPWEGTWKSDMNGHNGKLRAVVTKKSPTEYEFVYWATWGDVFSGSFPAVHTLKAKGKGYELSGTEDLGALGGVYTFAGGIDEKNYKATYKSSKGDHGVFEMARPVVEKKNKPQPAP